jgi:hypothetical protein
VDRILFLGLQYGLPLYDLMFGNILKKERAKSAQQMILLFMFSGCTYLTSIEKSA